ncbi:hypothetical protein APR04_001209 [Promicromonospora umidemergens]|uniref:Uncharacterized protein n=1 Tax=Promicromonospora umidemergens TaxID=629679 RepID=A0ABP8Y9Y6_9MICO|nr:hypothetical protein [Promicromonospora umidemergens]MCP2282311.1 hypothetical protein [Promicromonospora umidemergens]
MRIYVPATLDELDAVTHTSGAARWTVAPRRAHAVTKDLEAALPDDDAEALEYVAALNAADDSLALIAGRPDAPHQRVVITVEVPDTAVGPARDGTPGGADDDEPVGSEVEVTSTVEDVVIVCVHVDETEAAADIADVLAAADEESDAESTADVGEESETALDAALQRVTDRDLLWYDWSEIKDIPRG